MKNSLENYKLEGKELEIIVYPDPVLKRVAEKVEVFDEKLEEFCLNMLYTMYHAPGIGLAAPQVGVSQRIFVMDIDFDREEIELPNGDMRYKLSNFKPHVFINPVFKEKDGEIVYQEGCLSLPGIYEDVKRAESVVLEYQDIKGNIIKESCDGLRSICLQHENDHLDGIVMLEKLSPLKRNFYSKKLIKQKKRLTADV